MGAAPRLDTTGVDDAYVMPSYVKLLVENAPLAARFYEALGFERRHTDPVFIHLRWARYADLFLVGMPPGANLDIKRGGGVLLCYAATEVDLDTIAARALEQGAAIEGPAVQPWHTRELLVTDLDGYRLSFVEPG